MAHPEFPEGKPPAPDLPNYLLDPLEKQSPSKLDDVAEYASRLAAWKRGELEREEEQIRRESKKHEEELEDREVSLDPDDYDGVPASGAYITIKTTKQTGEKSYRYYYWQWREGDSWKNEYIAPVNPKE